MLTHFLRSARYRWLYRHAPSPSDLLVCADLIHAGDTVLDLGANLGIYSKCLSEMVGPSGHVHAVEMMPDTFLYLYSNVAELANVFCYNAAISGTSGIGKATRPEENGFYRSQLDGPEGQTCVRLFALDQLFADLRPSFIKCDVEGAELEVVAGARALIERCHPAWLIEAHKEELFGVMGSFGYREPTRLHDDWLFVHQGCDPVAALNKREKTTDLRERSNELGVGQEIGLPAAGAGHLLARR